MALRTPVAVVGALLGGALAAWIVMFVRMRGMDAAPGAELGELGWYLGIWVTMTAAMMLPATAPMVVVFSRVSRERARHRSVPAGPTCIFLAGYLVAWTLYALVALGVMNLTWMAAFAIVIFIQKVFPLGDRLAPAVAATLVALAAWVVVSP